jgi:hypothetical protein
MSFDYVRSHYGVPAEKGRRVTCYGKPGVIVGADGHYICVVLDADKSEEPGRYHPTHEVVYGDQIVTIPAMREWRCLAPWRDEWETDAWFTVSASTRSKARYKAFRELQDVSDMDGKGMCAILVRAAVPARTLKRRSPAAAFELGADLEDCDIPF